MKQIKYKLLIVYNKLYFYDIIENKCYKINCSKDSLKDDKIFNVTKFLKDIKNNEKLKKISNKLIGESLEIIVWENYTDADKKLLNDIFVDLNFSTIEYKDIKFYLNVSIAHFILSIDGIHYISDVEVYYNYGRQYLDLNETLRFIKNKNKIKRFIIISENIDIKCLDSHALVYENNKTFFDDLMKI